MRVTVRVTDAGDSVPRARVTGLPGGAKTSDANGSVVFTVRAGKNGLFGENGTFTLAATKAGYVAATAKLVLPAGIFVAPSGSDTTGDGSLSKPFATLAKAQATMRRGGPQITYIRGGYYALPAVTQNRISYGLHLTSADNGQTWSYYPPDGYDSAILDGGSTSSSTGIQELITIDGASHVTINGSTAPAFPLGRNRTARRPRLLRAVPGVAPRWQTATRSRTTSSTTAATTRVPSSATAAAPSTAIGNIPNTTVTNNAIYNISTSGIRGGSRPRGCGWQPELAADRQQRRSLRPACWSRTADRSTSRTRTRPRRTSVSTTTSFATAAPPPRRPGVSTSMMASPVRSSVTTSPPASSSWAFTIHGGSNNTISSNIVDLGTSQPEDTRLSGRWTDRNDREHRAEQPHRLRWRRRLLRRLVVRCPADDQEQRLSPARGRSHPNRRPPWPERRRVPCLRRSAAVLLDIRAGQRQPGLQRTGVIRSAPAKLGPPGYTVPATGSPPSQPHSC